MSNADALSRNWLFALLSLIGVLFVVASAVAQDAASPQLVAVVTPEDVDLEPEKLTEIDKLMSGEVDAGRIAGCIGLICRDEKIVFCQTWGDRDREKSQPMTEDTIFRIYSMSKPITSVAVMQLVEQGKLGLDDPAAKYLPPLGRVKVWTKDGLVDPVRPISVRDLLRHTSGLTYGFFGDSYIDKEYQKAGILLSDKTIEETVEKLGAIPLLHQPGTRWHYSVSTDVLGRLVEVVSEQRFDEYLQQHIFEPLGMVDTSFVVPKEKLHRFAQLYAPAGDTLKPASPWSSLRFTNPSNLFFSGGGGLCSTTHDYLRFSQMLLNRGELDGVRILSEASLAEMTTNQLQGAAARGGFKFGLGFSISPEGEFSWGGMAGTRFWVNPKRNMINLFMIQISPYRGGYGGKMKDVVFAADRREGSVEASVLAPMP